MSESVTDFARLGGRDYINAGTLLNAFLRALEGEGASAITVSRLKAQKIARANGRLVLSRDPAIDGAAGAHCVLTAKTNEGEWRGAFFDQGLPVREETAPRYSVTDEEADDYNGRCRIAPASREALVFDLIQANRRFHELTGGFGKTPVVRFGFLENWLAPPANVAFSGTVEAVNLITRRTADSALTVNRVTYTASGAATALVLCFEVTRAAGKNA